MAQERDEGGYGIRSGTREVEEEGIEEAENRGTAFNYTAPRSLTIKIETHNISIY